MKRRTTSVLYILKEHFMYIALSFILVFILSNALKNHLYIISIISAFMYVTSIYSLGWNDSNKAYKAYTSPANADKDKIPYNIYDGFINAIPLVAIAVAVLVLVLIDGEKYMWPFNIYNLSFEFLMRNARGELIVPVAIIVTLAPYIAYSSGYIAGKYGKILFIKYLPKIVYKKK